METETVFFVRDLNDVALGFSRLISIILLGPFLEPARLPKRFGRYGCGFLVGSMIGTMAQGFWAASGVESSG